MVPLVIVSSGSWMVVSSFSGIVDAGLLSGSLAGFLAALNLWNLFHKLVRPQRRPGLA